MLVFSTHELLDEQKCHDKLLEILHAGGLCCPQCRRPVSESKVHRRDRAPLLYYRCSCGRIYNAFARTIFEGTHRRCSQLVAFIQGVVQGKPTAHLARELHAGRGSLLELRHRLQQNALDGCPIEPLRDAVTECDEMYQNAGEKRSAAHRSHRSAQEARQ